MNAYTNQYRQAQVSTASPEQILIMLYDGAIRFVVQGKEAIAVGDRGKKLEVVNKAMAIVMELSETLDHEIGGEMAENLDALYHFMIKELTNANLKDDVKSLEAVEELLRDLRETWAQAIEINRNESAAATAEGPPAGYKPLSASL